MAQWLGDSVICRHHTSEGVIIPPLDFSDALGVLLVESGRVRAQIGGETATLAASQILFVPEGMMACVTAERTASVLLLAYPFPMIRDNMERLDRELFEMMMLQSRVSPLCLTQQDKIYLKVYEALRSAETEYSAKEPCYVLSMRAQACRITALLLRHYSVQRTDDDRLRYHNVARLAEALSYVERHPGEKLTVPLLAERIHLSADYFSHLVWRCTGKTAVAYLHAVRINMAMRLLCDTDQKIADVARAVGYDGADYFSRLFRDSCGCTPAAFRARMRA
ncbi:MAG: helix-turn-helix domain-containing protein [Clostridia bacterium]|nr:helix-turn-helix domain-containing protein [Clostridia bacterium]